MGVLPLQAPVTVYDTVYERVDPGAPFTEAPRSWYGQRFALNRLEQLPPRDVEVEQPLPDGGKWCIFHHVLRCRRLTSWEGIW